MKNIIQLAPACKDYLWGGTKLKAIYKDEASRLDCLSEAWVLSNHLAGVSRVTTEPYNGLLLSDYLREVGKEGLGSHCEVFDDFPILIKWIDAKQPLSIQVHPDDEYAQRVEGEYGKTEMWYILDCEDGASIYYGVNGDISREELKRRINDGTILDVLNKVPVHKGDVFFIEAGTIHAIGAGIVICEIQQNSNITYRVYDYDRRDASGNLRELHIDKALEVARLSPNPKYKKAEVTIETPEYKKECLGACKYFMSYEWDIKKEVEIPLNKDSFLSIIIVEGDGVIEKGEEKLTFKKGDSLFIPSQEGVAIIKGICRIITTQI